MNLLDTNVVSALMSAPPPPVVEWLNRSDSASLFLSTITLAEIAFGIESLPEGRRRDGMMSRLTELLAGGFDRRVLGFDSSAAFAYAEIMARRRRLGRPIGILDAQIAAIARANRLRVATHNTRDFEDCGVELVDPFTVGR